MPVVISKREIASEDDYVYVKNDFKRLEQSSYMQS